MSINSFFGYKLYFEHSFIVETSRKSENKKALYDDQQQKIRTLT